MKRRHFFSTAIACTAGRAIEAQPVTKRLRRIGLLAFGLAPLAPEPDPFAALLLGLRDLGHAEGRDISVERRYAAGSAELLERYADELARSVDVIVTGGPAPLLATRRATTSIPIVTISGSDPVREGWAQSLARPGGNVTGLTVTFPELAGKQLEVLKQALPAMTRVAVVFAPGELIDPGVEAGARALGLAFTLHEVRRASDLEHAVKAAASAGAQGLYAIATSTIVSGRSELARLCVAHGLPSISELTVLTQAGLLMGYGAELEDLGRRAANYVDKILKGARPAELAIERPAVFELVVNRKTARALGVALPASFLQRVTRFID